MTSECTLGGVDVTEDSRDMVVGFYNGQAGELAKPPAMRADAQVARWQPESKHGRDPTDQQRSWLVSKIRTDSHDWD